MTRSRFITALALSSILLFAALPESRADKKDEINWVQIMSTKGGGGGKSRFKIAKDAKVKIAWDVRPTSGSTSFRINLSKKHDRSGNYQTIGTIFKTSSPSKKHVIAKLKQGDYQLYLAVRRMQYEVKVYVAGD